MKRIGLLLAVVAVLGFVVVDGVLAAEGARGPGGRGTFGKITKIDGKTLTITSEREGNTTDVKAEVTDETQITKQAPVKLADLKVGDRVRIVQGDTRAGGEVTKIDVESKKVTVKGGRNNEEQTITVDDSTQITASVKAELKDLAVGQQVMASITDGKAVRISVGTFGARGGKKAKE
ncbi:MAG: DUF5666 domain-containing protein [Planctomycetota bacterium]|nr:DUF5666 domain-containing protein [Planctomycetota bacterium]